MTRVHGYVRFSYPGRSDARATRIEMTLEERVAILYAPLRMEQRFHLFENISLPALRAQTEPDFRISFLASPLMPLAYCRRLEAAVATLPQGQVVWNEAERVTDVLNPAIAEVTAAAAGMTFHFRLDDDDALCTTAIATMAAYCDTALPDELLSFPRGFLLIHHDGQVKLIRKYEDFIAIGLGFFVAPGTLRNPFAGRHRKIYRHVPTRLQPRLPAYILVAHSSSDTVATNALKLRKAERNDPHHLTQGDKVAALMESHFPFTVAELMQVMATMPAPAPVLQVDQSAAE